MSRRRDSEDSESEESASGSGSEEEVPSRSLRGGKRADSSFLPLAAAYKGLSARVEPCKKAPSACVTLGIPLRVNPVVLSLLKGGGTGEFEGDDVDTTVVAFAAFDSLYQELVGNPKNLMKYRAMDVRCGCTETEFLVSVTCHASFAVAKRNAAGMVKKLKFSSTKQMYSHYCMALSIKPSVEGFNHAVNECNRGAERLSVVFTGKVKVVDSDSLGEAAKMLDSKLGDLQDKAAGKKRGVASPGKVDMISIPVPSNLDAMLIKSFIDEHTTGAILAGNKLYIPAKFENVVSKLPHSPRMDGFVKKMAAMKDDLSGMLAYMAGRECGVSTGHIKSNRKYTAGDIKKLINDTLK